MVGDLDARRSWLPSPATGVRQRARRLADPLDQPGRRGDSPVSASTSWYFSDDDPALTTSTDAVIAASSPAAWIAVMATVLTMSRTAPRGTGR